MLPMMYPGVQQYMPAMGMGMGMNMGMDMGISRPMMPYQALMPGSGMPNPAVAANMGPRFPVPAFHMQPVPVPETSRIQAPNQLDPMLNSLVAPNPNQPRIPNFVDPYQQFIGIHQAQIPLPQASDLLYKSVTFFLSISHLKIKSSGSTAIITSLCLFESFYQHSWLLK